MASIHLLYLSSPKQASFCYLLSFPFSLFFSCWSFCSRCCFSSSCSCRCCSNFLWCSSSSCWCFIASISCCCCGEWTREKEKINKVRLIEGKTEVTISWQRCCLGHRNRKHGIFVVQRLCVLCSLISGSLNAVLHRCPAETWHTWILPHPTTKYCKSTLAQLFCLLFQLDVCFLFIECFNQNPRYILTTHTLWRNITELSGHALEPKYAITNAGFARPVQFPCAHAFLNKPLIIWLCTLVSPKVLLSLDVCRSVPTNWDNSLSASF